MESKTNDDDIDVPPSSAAKAVNDGYNQTYIILKNDYSNNEEKLSDSNIHEVFFRCGNWCYLGQIQFGHLSISLANIPVIIPTLQKQQGYLRYFCNSKTIPNESIYSKPLKFLYDSIEFFADEITSPLIEKELRKMSNIFTWIEDDNSQTYFELTIDELPLFMENINIIASKTYINGLIIISIYHDKSLYFILQNGEGDQPLLDVRFPDISSHGQGVLLSIYSNESKWGKITLWHILGSGKIKVTTTDIPKLKTISLASNDYLQTYCVMKSTLTKSNEPSIHRDVLFRFGSWCYSGRVQLVSSISLSDIPFVIPALRLQQSRLEYLCDVNNIPTNSSYAKILEYMKDITPFIESQIANSEESLVDLVDRLSKLGLGDSINNWLDGDPSNSFFEFKVSPDNAFKEAMKDIDFVASKTYQASGVITITVIFQDTVYVAIQDGSKENPLLDSKFPNISGKGRGYQIYTYDNGIDGWTCLRRVSIWQTIASLEEEFKQKVTNNVSQTLKSLTTRTPSTSINDLKSIDNKDLEDSARSVSDSIISTKAESKENNNTFRKLSTADNNNQDLHSITIDDEDTDERELKVINSDPVTKVQSLSSSVSRPHHIPKNDQLSKRLDELRKNLGDEGMAAPWDYKGRPLGPIGHNKK